MGLKALLLASCLLLPAAAAAGQEPQGQAVDLGLSVLWADRNVGAQSPADYAPLFHWNDFEKDFTPAWLQELPAEGEDLPFSGSGQDFAARSWGGSWRLPTREEILELTEKCTWTWTCEQGVNGMKVTGPNGNSIFLPASGRTDHGDLYDLGEYGHYWSGTLSSDPGHYLYELVFRDNGPYYAYVHKTAAGESIRPVQDRCHAEPLAGHIVLISLDGWASRGMDRADMPNVKALMEAGSWTLRKRSVWPTSSDKNWSSMFSGTGPEIHGVYSEKEGNYGSEKNIHGFESRFQNTRGVVPTLFTVYREKYPEAEIGAFYQWGKIHDFLDWEVCDRVSQYKEDEAGDEKMCEEAVAYILEKKPRLLMLGWDHPDCEGHEWGWYSKPYFATLKRLDSYIGRVIEALKEAGIWEDTVLLLTSDHGGTGRAHHGSTIMEFEAPFILCGKGIRPGHEIQAPMIQYDVAATVAALAGADPPQVWVGKPAREAFLDKTLRSPAPAPVSRKAGHVVVIGMDGWASEGMDRAKTPHLKRLIAEGSSTLFKSSVVPTLSTENWASMFNGLPVELHGFYTEIGDSWRSPLVTPAVLDGRGITPTVFTLARAQYPDLEMGAIHQWSGIGNLIDKDAFNHYAQLPFREICDDAVDYIRTKKPDLTLIIWDEPDGTGHEKGWYSREYFNRLKELDTFIGRLEQALSDAGILDDTLLIFTSDHGGTAREAHGGTEAAERYTPFVVWGKGIRKGHVIQASVLQFDVAAVIADALGVSPAPWWYGRPIHEIYE